MITDRTALAEIRESWKGVEALRGRLQTALLGAFAQGGWSAIFAADAAHNLPFVHAYAVLNDVLEELAGQGRFTCKSIFLRKLLEASEKTLPWRNFALIEEGAERRNGVAHRGEILPRGDCWKYVDAIKQQLVAWDILKAS